MLRQLLHPLARIGRWTRLAAAAVCLLLAAVSALEASARDTRTSEHPSGPAVLVVVAVRALPVGQVLARRDVDIARWPKGLRPVAAFDDPRNVIGRRLAGSVAAREPVTRHRLLGADLSAGLAPGTVAVPITLDSEVARLVHAGDRVELIATARPDVVGSGGAAPRAAEIVVRSARVLAMFEQIDPAIDTGGTQLVLAVSRELALRIATLRSTQVFTVVVDPP